MDYETSHTCNTGFIFGVALFGIPAAYQAGRQAGRIEYQNMEGLDNYVEMADGKKGYSPEDVMDFAQRAGLPESYCEGMMEPGY